jgi:hypothetical protein
MAAQESFADVFVLFSLYHPRRNETVNWINVRSFTYQHAFPSSRPRIWTILLAGSWLLLREAWPDRRTYRLTTPILGDLRPSFKKDALSKNEDVNYWVDRYLGVGEWVMDQSVAIAGSSGWFERKR